MLYNSVIRYAARLALVATLAGASTPSLALDWSDNSVGWRYGSNFREPFNSKNISKNIFMLTHASGYQYGSNYFNADFLMSDSNDPSSATSTSGASEVYLVYRHTLDLGKLRGRDIRFGPMRGLGVTAGFDFNSKKDMGYNSRKQMFVLGPTFMMDVPGFLNVSLLALWESNHPSISAGTFNPGYPAQRYSYATHPMLSAAWSIPLKALPLSFEGYANFIAAKGKDELGRDTAAETNMDMQLMYDVGAEAPARRSALRIGLEYQYWRNKFGNSNGTVGAAGGNAASTPMLRIEYHF